MSDPKNLKNDSNSYDCLIALGDAQNGDAHEGETPHCEPDTEEAVPAVSKSETDWTAKPLQEKTPALLEWAERSAKGQNKITEPLSKERPSVHVALGLLPSKYGWEDD